MMNRIEVLLEDNMPDYMAGLVKISSINVYDSNDEMIDELPNNFPRISDLVGNGEFRSEEHLKDWISEKLNVPNENIEIIE